MGNLWEVIKLAFSGIFNWGTVVILSIGFTVYCVFAILSIYFDQKDHLMSVIATLQLKLGAAKNKMGKGIASWLWTLIMNLDYNKRCRFVVYGDSEKEKLWIIRQFINFRYNRKIANTCRFIAFSSDISKKLSDAARDVLKKVYNH